MKRRDYAALDAELLRLIAVGCNSAFRLTWREYEGLTMPRDYRVIERRLQALRKAGRITCNGAVWTLCEPKSAAVIVAQALAQRR